MREPIKIAVAEDHYLFREGLIALLDDEEDISLAFDVSNGEELLQGIENTMVDIVLIDLNMPVMNGQQTLRLLKERYPEVRPIVLSMYSSNDYISDAIRLGARGFLPKNCNVDQVVDAIYAVKEQGYYFDDEISKSQIFRLVHEIGIDPTFKSEELSKREVDVLELICDEKSNNEIADKLCISVRTVEVHRQNLLRKTNAKNVAGLVVYAIKNGHFRVDSH